MKEPIRLNILYGLLAIIAVLALRFILGSLVRPRPGSLSYSKLEQLSF